MVTKKLFDSVDHGYIERMLRTKPYKVTAKLLINGTKSRIIKILKVTKQADPLSCAILINCHSKQYEPFLDFRGPLVGVKRPRLTCTRQGSNSNS